MTPAARLSAAIEILDRVLAGTPAEQALTGWGRANRFAGSGDRHALRDLVFAALRRRRSFAALGGAATGRGMILGSLRAEGIDPADLFTGVGHAPAVVGPEEMPREMTRTEALDLPDWLEPRLRDSLGETLEPVMRALQRRAPVFLRVNLMRGTRAAASEALAALGIATRPVDWVATALEVTENERKIQTSGPYLEGLVELQDASSQAVVAGLGIAPGMRCLDYCAGGGGKTLAMAALGAEVDAHDANPGRMVDLPGRASRAGARVKILENGVKSCTYDLILMDVPCSGSGSWRRDPQGKWALTEARLAEILPVQAQIMDRCAPLLRTGGTLAYATCSLLRDENEAQVQGFLARHPGWRVVDQTRFSPLQGGDGFFVALLTQSQDVIPQP